MSRIAIGKTAAELEPVPNEGVSPPVFKKELEDLWHSDPNENRLARYVPYPRQAAFHAAGATARERLLMAGNQLGKTLAGGFEVAMHMTGRYPAWWCGKPPPGEGKEAASGGGDGKAPRMKAYFHHRAILSPRRSRGEFMRVAVCAVVLTMSLAVRPALAEPDRSAAAFWRAVQTTCNATAAKPPSELGQRIARTAIDEFNHFGGHQIDANGKLFRFGLTEAEHEQDEGGSSQAKLGQLGWWQVMKYWRALYGDEAPDKLEVRGYHDGSVSKEDAQDAALMRTSAAELLRAAESVTDPAAREILREAALRAAVVDTSWSAAFISYVIRQSGVAPSGFHFSNAHRAFIYDAFATSADELNHKASEQIYRACPATSTRPRVGDLICAHREPALADLSDADVRERIRMELEGGGDARSIRRTHCEVVVHIDAGARKMYTIGGNVNQAVAARKLNLHGRDLKFSAHQGAPCGRGAWTLRQPDDEGAHASGHDPHCSLNDKKWFVLLQLR